MRGHIALGTMVVFYHPARHPHGFPTTGLLVPDIPLEETPEIREVASSHGLELVLLTTPTTPQPRMRAIAESSQGFVYLVSLTGALRCKKTARGWQGE